MTSQPHRLPDRGRVDRARPLDFVFDGTPLTGYRGDTLASALLANGVHRTGRSVRLGRPRGIHTAGSEEPCALVQVESPFPEPLVPATTLELHEGLRASSLAGRGRLSPDQDPARYDTLHAHCDLLVVGAGPAGLAAALAAAHSGARVVLADEQPEPGGSLLGTGEYVDGLPGAVWAARARTEIEAAGARFLPRTTVSGYFDDNYLLAVERRTAHLGDLAPASVSRERVWRIRARRVLLATGAHERSLAFADNDRPGIMLAGAARAYLHRWGVLPGRRAVVLTTNDSAYAGAGELAAAGLDIAAVLDARPRPGRRAARAARAGLDVRAGQVVLGTGGEEHLSSVTAAVRGDADRTAQDLDADLLLVSGGWSPAVHLYSQSGGRLRFDEGLGAFLPAGSRQRVESAGAARGIGNLAGCLADGAAAGRRLVEAEGFPAGRTASYATEPEEAETPPVHLYVVPGRGGSGHARHFVDLARDVTVADLGRATRAGLRSVEHIKRHTTAGTGRDQGRTSALLTTGALAQLLGAEVGELGTTTFRAPYHPVSMAALAGRDRGRLFDPVRVTPLHAWHTAHGAAFENVGQWKRAWYYPREGEDMAAAVERECRAARTGVALMDASTLGKIDVQGPDAGVFLDRLYTNMMSTLKVGRIRYGVMCRADGMVFDDGTVLRAGPDRFLATTTTGNAAAVLDWMEQWLQTEWTDLRVRCTSVTDHWATLALVGPASRALLAGLAPDLAVDNDSFPFMSLRDAVVAGVRARVCRISFSGELAYEINVRSWEAPAVWESLYEAGRPLDLTPYGTETMHVLRAEKGYPIIGQDTDGTVTPQDLGMSWVVSKKKADFLGRRSHSRADTSRADRPQLVALLPADPHFLLPEGTQLVAEDTLPAERPVPMLGNVTSSYRSAALDRTFALALVKGGRERTGQLLYARTGEALVPVTVAHPVLYDPEGERRDG